MVGRGLAPTDAMRIHFGTYGHSPNTPTALARMRQDVIDASGTRQQWRQDLHLFRQRAGRGLSTMTSSTFGAIAAGAYFIATADDWEQGTPEEWDRALDVGDGVASVMAAAEGAMEARGGRARNRAVTHGPERGRVAVVQQQRATSAATRGTAGRGVSGPVAAGRRRVRPAAPASTRTRRPATAAATDEAEDGRSPRARTALAAGASPPARRARRITPGTTELSQRAQQVRIAARRPMSRHANVAVARVEVSVDGQRIGVEFPTATNDSRTGHSEPHMHQAIQQLQRALSARHGGRSIHLNVTHVYSERQPCGPRRGRDCEGLLRRRFPAADVTFGYDYQAPGHGGSRTRRRAATVRIAASQARIRRSGQPEADPHPGRTPPTHFEEDEPGFRGRGQ